MRRLCLLNMPRRSKPPERDLSLSIRRSPLPATPREPQATSAANAGRLSISAKAAAAAISPATDACFGRRVPRIFSRGLVRRRAFEHPAILTSTATAATLRLPARFLLDQYTFSRNRTTRAARSRENAARILQSCISSSARTSHGEPHHYRITVPQDIDSDGSTAASRGDEVFWSMPGSATTLRAARARS